MRKTLLTIIIFITIVPILTITTKTQTTDLESIPNEWHIRIAPYAKFGKKYYYLENKNRVNWFDAAHKCRQIRGHLVNIESARELEELKEHLNRTARYWTSINRLGKDEKFVSLATGSRIKFARWSPGNPNNVGKNEYCVHLWFKYNNTLTMNDEKCALEAYYICESNVPKVHSIIIW